MTYKYQIRFTNSSGERTTYMNIGFYSRESAQLELDKILIQKEKMKGLTSYLNRSEDYNLNRTCLGKNFRIKKVKTYPLSSRR